MAFQGFGQKQGFGKDSGPVAAPKAQVFGRSPRPPSPPPPFSTSPLQQSTRPATSSPMWGNQVRFPGSNSWTRDDYSGASPSGSVKPFATKQADTLVPIRTRSPPLQSASVVSPDKSSQTYPGSPAISPTMWGNQVRLPGNFSNSWSREDVSAASLSDPGKPFATMHGDTRVPVSNRSPPLQPQNGVYREKSGQTDFGRRSLSPPILGNRSDSISTIPDSVIPHTSLGSAQSNDNKAVVTNATNYPVPKRNRSVELSSTDEVFQRHSAAQTGARSIDDRLGAAKPTHLPVSKRTRSPPLPANQVFSGNSLPPDDSERELQAKAKRLARFKVELSQPEQSTPGNGNPSSYVNKRAQSLTDRPKMMREHSSEMEEDSSNAGVPSDYEGPESCTVIIGLCPDMCPQSEREERERKGDLDQFERLDGDRNRTTESLAVKKYTRTAEREAELIRPMPILQKTIAYLLYLLDQPYDEKFLGLYNFLWDRMRAIRMDLRMQHLFNLNAITMLEQMIRLHIIAMHELCEHTKGEGFSEGFDAHLNIEQMNKTSVELFQLYEDHRKKGINVPTEKEFRGYYALLKLDKHPGYKVEPAELSHDLSKMTPEIRQTSEVLFARDVARACRTGNFIAFFRLARKASYLQACLMHAHFAKLRTQALASLHCGLQNNQGIPVTLVAKWLAMEEDDMENLLEYHGFVIKEFEEPYMVKEGAFLNNENDYPLKCSKLVHLKRSQMIVEDVSSPRQTALLPAKEAKSGPLMKVRKQEIRPVLLVESKSTSHVADAVMAEYRGSPSPKDDAKSKLIIKTLPVVDHSGGGTQMASFSQFSRDFSFGHNLPKFPQVSVQSFKTPTYNTILPDSFERPNDDTSVPASFDGNTHANEKATTWQALSAEADQEKFSILERSSSMKASVPQDVPIQDVEDEVHQVHAISVLQSDEIESSFYDEEAYEAKLRLFLRIWRRRAVKKRELREQRQLVAVAALSSLSLGPPVRQKVELPSTPGGFNIDDIMNERYQRHERSWSRLNVSNVIARVLSGRNTAAKCICWKMIICSHTDIQGNDTQQQSQSTAWPWLLSKLIPSENYEEDDLVIPSPGISIWRKWVASQNNVDFTSFLSVVRKAELHNARDEVLGANAILFFVSESIPLEVQKFQLHSLVMSLPSGSRLPLLILTDSSEENIDSSSVMAEKLGLLDLDRSRVGSSSIVFLVENKLLTDFDGFFSDEKLRGGLQWLASQSASQPVVSRVKTHYLVSTHLSSSLQMLEAKSVYEVGPNHCISAFNEVLYEAAEKVSAAAAANPSSWPCPETALLDEAMKLQFPDIGWSSSAKIEPAISALRSCELAAFEDDVSWLFEGSNSGRNIENQKTRLTNCLIKYLSERSQVMGSSLARKEAHVMLQQNARLEFHDSTYYIIPNWINIFRRIFNWRLMSLWDGPFSMVYVMEQDIPRIPNPGFDTSLSPYHATYPSLDEMVEVSFGSHEQCNDVAENDASQRPVIAALDCREATHATDTSNRIERTFTSVQDSNVAGTNDANRVTMYRPNVTRGELVPALEASREADRLNKLLDQCNILQDTIDKKLSIYF